MQEIEPVSDHDVPSGPLGRLRAQLAGPRGMRRIDALLSTDDAVGGAKGAIALLAPNEIYELVHEVGFEDAADLIALATPQQIQGCLDLDGWAKDELELRPLELWISAVLETGFENVGQVWAGLDAELRALILQREVKVYDVTLEEAPPDVPENEHENPVMTTSDRFFMLELLGNDESQRLVMQLIEDLYRADPDLARHTIMSARSEPPAELEEQAYRWRSGRLADLGYVDFYDALDLFRPLDADQVKIGEGTQERASDDSTPVSLVVAEEVLGRSFLARAISGIDDARESERLEAAVMVLVNKVLAAGRAKPGQQEVVRRGALYATATLSVGLETLARGDLVKARDALRTVGLTRLFRVGYTVTLKLARLAQALAARSTTAGSPAKELVAGLCSPRPLFSRAADLPPAAGVRPFEAASDLRRAGEVLAGLTVRIALVEGLGVDVVALGLAPEPRLALDDLIRTAVVHAMVHGELRIDALTQTDLTQLRDFSMAAGKLKPDARALADINIRERLGAQQLAASGTVLGALVDGWLTDIEGILGGIKDAEVDPRFVEGVVVEIRRS